jgi:hypothetical protein
MARSAGETSMTPGLAYPGDKNPAYSLLEKGGKTAASVKSPFFKGGFRGILKVHDKACVCR